MNEIYWRQYTADTPAFFRDSLVQFVARTYYLTRDIFIDRSHRLGRLGAGGQRNAGCNLHPFKIPDWPVLICAGATAIPDRS